MHKDKLSCEWFTAKQKFLTAQLFKDSIRQGLHEQKPSKGFTKLVSFENKKAKTIISHFQNKFWKAIISKRPKFF